MSVDRGGVHYPIVVENQFSTALEQFKQQLRDSRSEWGRFKKSLASGRTHSRDIANQSRQIKEQTQGELRASRQLLNETKSLTRQETIRLRALRQLNREVSASEVAARRAVLAQRTSYRVERDLQTALEARQRAERDLTQTLNKRRVLEARGRAEQARNAQLTDEERKKLGLLTQQELELLSAKQRRSKAGITNESSRIQQINAEAAALKRLNKAIQEQETEKLLAARGYDRYGKPLKTPQAKAQEQAEKDVGKVLDQRRVVAERLAAAQKQNAQLTEDERRRLKLLTVEQRRLLDAKKRLQAVEAARGNRELQRITAETEALRRRNRIAQEQRVTSLLESQGFDASGKQLAAAKSLKDRIKDFFKLSDAAHSANDHINRISFTFRRLFGILAAFAAARAVVNFFTHMVKDSVKFNAEIEQSRLGIASLLVAVGQVRDTTGQAVSSSHALALAQKEARKQTALLRQDAVKANASFNQLAQTFQVALAPGLRGGLDVDEIRTFSVRIAQAANAIGMSQNQLAEEIRSVLAGTIQARTTRIATSLGITNEDIRRAKEMGTLAEFLNEKFAAFAAAGEEAQNTFNGLVNKVKNFFTLILQQGSLQFFQKLKSILRETFDLITDTDPLTGLLAPSEDAVAIIQAFSDGLTQAADAGRRLIRSLDFDDVLRTTKALGIVIGSLPRILGAAISGAITGVGDVLGLLEKILSAFGKEFRVFDLSNIEKTVELLAKALVWLVSIRAAIVLIPSAFQLITVATQALVATLMIAAKTVKSFALGIEAAFVGATGAVKGFGTALAFITAHPIVALLTALAAALVAVGIAWKRAANNAKKLSREMVEQLKLGNQDRRDALDRINRLKELSQQHELNNAEMVEAKSHIQILQEQYGDLGLVLNKATNRLEGFTKAQKALNDLLRQQAIDELEQAVIEAQENLNKVLENPLEPDEPEYKPIGGGVYGAGYDNPKYAASLAKAEKAQERRVRQARTELAIHQQKLAVLRATETPTEKQLTGQEDVTDEIKNQTKKALDLSQVFRDLPGIISQSFDVLDKQGDLLKGLIDDIKQAKNELDTGLSLMGSSGSTEQQRRLLLDTAAEFRKKNEQTYNELKSLEQDILNLQRERYRLQHAESSLSEKDQKLARTGLKLGHQFLETQNAVAETESEILVLKDKVNRAQGDERKALIQQWKEARRKLAAQKDSLLAIEAEANALKTDAENAAKVNDIIRHKLELEGRDNALQAGKNQLLEQQKKLEDKLNEARNYRLRLMAEQNRYELQQQLPLDQLKLRGLKNQTDADNKTLQALALQEAKLRLDTVRQEVAAREQVRQKKEQDKLAVIQTAKSQEDLNDITQDLAVIRETNKVKQQQDNELIRQAQVEYEKLVQQVNAPVRTGILDGLRAFAREAPTVYESVFAAVQNGLENVSDSVAEIITDAFDPSSNASIQEKIAQFMRTIAQHLLSAVINSLIVQLVTSIIGIETAASMLSAAGATITGSSAALTTASAALAASAVQLESAAIMLMIANSMSPGGGSPAPAGARDGGPVSAFRKARGFARGGIPNRPSLASLRPKGLHPSDTVPIWAAPGEWVIRAASVRKYGSKVINAINEGLVDPFSLRALAPLSASVRRPRLPGFAEGGMISSSSTSSHKPAANKSSDLPGVSIVVGDNQSMDRLLAGGKDAMLRFLQRHRSQVKASIGA